MKKNYIFSFLLFLISFNIFSQVTLEHTYTNTTEAGLVQISPGIYKYFVHDENTAALKLYNLNHSIYKTINYPMGTSTYREVLAISENLFDTDPQVEIFVQYSYSSGYQAASVAVINEDGSTLFSEDSCFLVHDDVTNLKTGIINSGSGSKLILLSYKHPGNRYKIYSLPGTLSALMSKEIPVNFVSLPQPNPSSETTKIDFELPNGEEGEIFVYNQQGIYVKSYKVDNSFGSLLLNNSDLPSGMYYYNLKTRTSSSGSQKMMIIK